MKRKKRGRREGELGISCVYLLPSSDVYYVLLPNIHTEYAYARQQSEMKTKIRRETTNIIALDIYIRLQC